MEILSKEQSTLLKKLDVSPLHYRDLSDSEKDICNYLIKNNLAKASLICEAHEENFVGIISSRRDVISITEEGKRQLINEKLTFEEYSFLEKQMQSLRNLADTAMENAKSAKKDAIFSKLTSIIAIVISVIAIVASVLVAIYL